jgi:hypothetical protein
MSNSVDILKNWFDELPATQKEEILEFLYAGKILLHNQNYIGPNPNLVTKGLHLGPAPLASTSRVCQTCGRPW